MRDAQVHGVVAKRLDHPVHILGRAEIAVFALQDCPHGLPRGCTRQRSAGAQIVVQQMRHPGITGSHGRFVVRVHDDSGAVALIKPDACLVLLQRCRIRAGDRIIRKAFQQHGRGPQGQGILADALVEGTTDAPADAAAGGGQIVEITEVQLRFVQDDGKAKHAL